jgi:hypothetical protein
MMDVRHIESLLRINGLQKTASNEEIRSVLLSARFKDDEIDTALMVLRENTDTKETKFEGLHKVFRSDQALKPDEISRLLGINVDIKETIRCEDRRPQRNFSFLQMFVIWLTSIIIAIAGVLFYMYSNQMGVFHPLVNLAIDDER